jgi:hypothetical protein
MSPLGFDAKKLYRFVTIRFKKTSAKVQEQALNWLQVRRVPLYSDTTYTVYETVHTTLFQTSITVLF